MFSPFMAICIIWLRSWRVYNFYPAFSLDIVHWDTSHIFPRWNISYSFHGSTIVNFCPLISGIYVYFWYFALTNNIMIKILWTDFWYASCYILSIDSWVQKYDIFKTMNTYCQMLNDGSTFPPKVLHAALGLYDTFLVLQVKHAQFRNPSCWH